jgi:hypothetical protein
MTKVIPFAGDYVPGAQIIQETDGCEAYLRRQSLTWNSMKKVICI